MIMFTVWYSKSRASFI